MSQNDFRKKGLQNSRELNFSAGTRTSEDINYVILYESLS